MGICKEQAYLGNGIGAVRDRRSASRRTGMSDPVTQDDAELVGGADRAADYERPTASLSQRVNAKRR